MMTNGRQSSYTFKGRLENEQKSDIVNEYEILIFSLLPQPWKPFKSGW